MRARAGLATSWWGRILAEGDTAPTELGAALLALGLGLHLLLPFDTFGSGSIYGALAVLPEWVWGSLLTALGMASALTLRSRRRSGRRTLALVGSVVWFTFGCSFLVGDPANTGGFVYSLAAVGLGWCYVRLGLA